MKTQLKSMLHLVAGLFLILTGCQKSDGFVSPSAQSAAKKADATASTELSSSKALPVTITGTYDFSTFPNVSGTFTTSGALTISGTTTMDIDPIVPGSIFHCVVTLFASDGTITIHQECEFATSPPKGQWQIVSGTGAYANLKGNGSLLMPPNTEAMVGFIH